MTVRKSGLKRKYGNALSWADSSLLGPCAGNSRGDTEITKVTLLILKSTQKQMVFIVNAFYHPVLLPRALTIKKAAFKTTGT